MLAWHAEAIRARGKRIVGDAIEIGRHLVAAKKLIGPGNWQSWLEREFQWTDDTALNLMNFYRWYEKDPERVRNTALPWRSLYLLARPSTPEPARQEVLERVERGEQVSVAEVKDAITKAKGEDLDAVSNPPESPSVIEAFSTDCAQSVAEPKPIPDNSKKIAGLFEPMAADDQVRCLMRQVSLLKSSPDPAHERQCTDLIAELLRRLSRQARADCSRRIRNILSGAA